MSSTSMNKFFVIKFAFFFLLIGGSFLNVGRSYATTPNPFFTNINRIIIWTDFRSYNDVEMGKAHIKDSAKKYDLSKISSISKGVVFDLLDGSQKKKIQILTNEEIDPQNYLNDPKTLTVLINFGYSLDKFENDKVYIGAFDIHLWKGLQANAGAWDSGYYGRIPPSSPQPFIWHEDLEKTYGQIKETLVSKLQSEIQQINRWNKQ